MSYIIGAWSLGQYRPGRWLSRPGDAPTLPPDLIPVCFPAATSSPMSTLQPAANAEPEPAGSIGPNMGTMHRTIDRPLTLRVPRVAPLSSMVDRRTIRLAFATAVVGIIGGICLGFIVGYAVALAMQVGP